MPNPLAVDLEHVFAHTADLWEELRGQNIFITGGTGFFGCWLLESFAWANERLNLSSTATVLTRNPSAFCERVPHLASCPKIRLIEGDVRDFVLPRDRFSHVIHAATAASARLHAEQPEEMLDTTVQGTRRVLEFAVGGGAKKILFISSGAVYGKQPAFLPLIPEYYDGGPDVSELKSVYGEGKRMAELLCQIYAERHGFEIKIARGFAFLGPYMQLNSHFAIGNFIRDQIMGGPIVVQGDGTPFRSYLYASDLAIWLWTILVRGVSGRPYNVGSGEPRSIAQIAQAVAEALEPRVAIEIRGAPLPGIAPERYIPSVERAKNELNLVPHVSLPEAIRKTREWAIAADRPATV